MSSFLFYELLHVYLYLLLQQFLEDLGKVTGENISSLLDVVRIADIVFIEVATRSSFSYQFIISLCFILFIVRMGKVSRSMGKCQCY